MSRLNKIIALFIVVVFGVTTYLFLVINKKKNEDLSTKIVQDEEEIDKKKKASGGYNMILGKINEIEDGDVEYVKYVELMDGLVDKPKEERTEKKIKITDDTEIEVPCTYLESKIQIENEGLESLEQEEEQGQEASDSVAGEFDEEESCEGAFEDLKKGDFILISKKGNEVDKIRKKL